MTDTIDVLASAAKRMLEEANGSHAWDHTLRVVSLCKRIGSEERADMEVLLGAAYLHDIGRSRQDASNGRICHAEIGAEMAGPIIAGLPLTDIRKENILHCIRTHRFRSGCFPETLEAKVLYDADKLDAIGAVGVARAFLFAGEVGARLHNPDVDIEKTLAYSSDDTGYREYHMKLRHLRDRILTPTGRKLAAERHRFMASFFECFLEEYQGKR